MCFCINLEKMHHITKEDFKTTNSYSVDQNVHQSLNVAAIKYFNNVCRYYMKKVFEYAFQGRTSARNNYARLKVPF